MSEYATDLNLYPHTQFCKNNYFLYFSITEFNCSSPDYQCKIQLHVSVVGSSITPKIWGTLHNFKGLKSWQHILPVVFPWGQPQNHAL